MNSKGEDNNIYEIEKIVDHRRIPNSNNYEFKIRWWKYKACDDTWQPAQDFLGAEAARILRDYIKQHLMKDNVAQVWKLNSGARFKKVVNKNDDNQRQDQTNHNQRINQVKMAPMQAKKLSPEQNAFKDELANIAGGNESESSDSESDQSDEEILIDFTKYIQQELDLLEKYEEPVQDFEEWKSFRKNKKNYDINDPDWSQMIVQTSKEFESERFQILLNEFSKINLYTDYEKFDQHTIFTNKLWHPGRQDQRNHACLIHSLNSYVGGPLFDTADKFLALYQSRLHMKKCRAPEFPWEHGLSFKNLSKIIYNQVNQTWLSPRYIHTFTLADIQSYAELDIEVNDMLNVIKPSRVIIQYKTTEIFDISTGEIIRSECHAAAMTRIKQQWYLLDNSENRAINLAREKDFASNWIKDIEFLNIIEMIVDNPPQKLKQSFLKEWNFIMKGVLKLQKGGCKRQKKSYRKMINKKGRSSKINSNEESKDGNKIAQKAQYTIIKNQQQKVLGLLDAVMSESQKRSSMKEYTKKAREVRQSKEQINKKMSELELTNQQVLDELENTLINQKELIELKNEILSKDYLLSWNEIEEEYGKKHPNEIVVSSFELSYLEASEGKLKLYYDIYRDQAKKKLIQDKLTATNKRIAQLIKEKHKAVMDKYSNNLIRKLNELMETCILLPWDYIQRRYSRISKANMQSLKQSYDAMEKVRQDFKENMRKVASQEEKMNAILFSFSQV